MASTNDLKNGMVLKLDNGQLWSVVEFQHVKPGKGPAFVRTKLKHVLSGKVVDKTFNAGVKVETASVDKRGDAVSPYKDGADFVFMDLDTYDQIQITPAVPRRRRQLPARGLRGHRRRCTRAPAVRRAADLGRAGRRVHRARRPGRPLHRRRQAGPAWRPAHEIGVPLFIVTGEKIKVDTRHR